jgi:prefoldin subunit 5
VGRPSTAEDAITAALPPPHRSTQDPEWYAEQAAKLQAQLESNEAELQRYRQTIEDARSLKTTTGGINLGESDIGITPEAGIEILQQRVSETQSELEALETLARRSDIPPGALRGQ